MLTFGEWKIAILSMIFGGAIVGGWLYGEANGPVNAILAQPALTIGPTDQPRTAAQSPVIAEAEKSLLPELAAFGTDDNNSVPAAYYIAQAASVVSGDSFYLEGVPKVMALWGIEVPAEGVSGSGAASAALAALVADRMLSCENLGVDEKGRVSARCFTDEGAELSQELIKSGSATPISDFNEY
ncbi:MAG: hypothetical protein R3C42_02805 [Parvularculaceae bacterium]|nr:hypothetical protein [Parvularculaceae bacterium]